MTTRSVPDDVDPALLHRLLLLLLPTQTVSAAKAALNDNGRFAYYTTADTAYRILRHREIWMRNAATLNDFSEIRYGRTCLRNALENDGERALRDAVDSCFPNLIDEIKHSSQNTWTQTLHGTYLTCISEHCPKEDEHGRLSMWRGYGHTTGVALILQGSVLFNHAGALGFDCQPVRYATPEEFYAEFLELINNLKTNSDFLKTCPREHVKRMITDRLRIAVTCTKHPAFAEEREWRIVATPDFHWNHPNIRRGVETIREVPQHVLKLTFGHTPGGGLPPLELPTLVQRIIIGPCEFPTVTGETFLRLLIDAKDNDPNGKIKVSNIPLRRP